MRLFAAVDPGEQVRAALTPWLDARAGMDGVRWTPPANLHATLRFLGEQPADAVPALAEALRRAVADVAAGEVRCGAPDAFPDRRRPRVLILPLTSDGLLEDLAARVVTALDPWRPRAIDAAFRAHLTLGRVRRSAPADLAARLATLPDPAPPPFRAAAVALVQSMLGPEGARYAVLERFPLADAESRM